MFNKKRIFVFVVFILLLLFMMTYASAPAETVRIITREIKFIDGFNNTELARYDVEVGTSVNPPQVPTHYNKAFAGWYDYYDNTIKIEDFSSILNDTSAVALYGDDLNGNGILDDDEDHYLVTFVNGITNETLKEENILAGMDAIAPENPYVSGYTFAGWNNSYINVQSNLTIASVHNRIITKTNTTPTTPVNNNSTTNNKKTYIVTFVDGFNNEVISKEEIEEGLSASTPKVPAHDNKVFTEWVGNYVNVKKNEIVTAIYADDLNNDKIDDREEGQKLIVIFLNEGKEVKREIVLKGNDATAPSGPFTKEETDKYTFTFAGWDKEFINVQTNLTINAKYNEAIKKYTVKVIDGKKEETKEVNYGEEIELGELSKQYKLTYSEATDSKTLTYNANFIGYCKDSNTCDEKISGKQTITKDTVFYAIWDDEPLNVIVLSGRDYQTVSTNYTFDNWTDELNKTFNSNDNLLLDKDKVLIANYKENAREYILTVNYVFEDGSKAAESKVMNIVNGTKYLVNSPDINKAGYTADRLIVSGTMPTNDIVETVIYKANELEFNCEDIIKDYSLDDQFLTFNSASNGSGSYTYALSKESASNFEVNDRKMLTIKGGTQAGNYEIAITAKDKETNKTKEVKCKVIINKVDATCPSTVTSYKGEYDAKPHTITVSEVSDGTLEYSIDNNTWSQTIPTMTDAGITAIYIRVVGDKNHNDVVCNGGNSEVSQATITIEKIDATCPEINSYIGNYDEENHSIEVGLTEDGTIQYRTNENEEWINSNPQIKDAGQTTVYVRVFGDRNHNTKDCGSKTITINKVNAKCPSLREYNGNYDGESHSIRVGTTNDGIVQYKSSGSSEWSTILPTRTEVGTTIVNIQVVGDKNHNNSRCNNKNINISPRAITVKTENQNKVYDGTALIAASDCKIIIGTLLNNHTFTCNITGSQTDVGNSEKIISKVNIKDENNNDVSDNYIVTPVNATLTVTKADAVCPETVTPYNGNYDGIEHTITISNPIGGTLEYSIDNENWTETLPKRKDVGITMVYIRVKGDENHNNVNCSYETSNSTITINPII